MNKEVKPLNKSVRKLLCKNNPIQLIIFNKKKLFTSRIKMTGIGICEIS